MSAMKKRALGRGLDALLGSDPPETAVATAVAPAENGVKSLPVVMLRPNPYQPRETFNDEALDELTASIQEKGILQPLVVRKAGAEYEIVAGERRWRAAQRAGLAEVPVWVREFSDQDMLEMALIENLQREDLNPVEEAHAYQKLVQEFNMTQDQVADRVGKSRVAVTNALRLLKLPPSILSWVEEDRISAGHARALLTLAEEPLQMALAREIMGKGLSVREAEKRVRRLVRDRDKPARPAQGPDASAHTRELEEKLSLRLGLKVHIQPQSNTAGRVEVYYANLEEFQALLDHLGITVE
ncbi:ParB/RepB/Spo0J family partition protein [bacterium]|nr:ParB/RepB/Spo0J family partition protein [bacterium]